MTASAGDGLFRIDFDLLGTEAGAHTPPCSLFGFDLSTFCAVQWVVSAHFLALT
jgi:hypothetical protein